MGWAVLGVASAAMLWWIWPGDLLFPSLSSVVAKAVWMIGDGGLWQDLRASLHRVFVGVVLGTLIAATLALLAYSVRPVGRMLFGVTEVVRPIPPIAWTPVAILLFGVGDPPAIAIVAVGSFGPIWFSLLQGIENVREEHLKAARSLGSGRLGLLLRVVVPAVTPHFMAGIRLGVGVGWFCIVAAEMMGISSGLGQGVLLYSLNVEMEAVFVYLIVIGLAGATINALIAFLERIVVVVPISKEA